MNNETQTTANKLRIGVFMGGRSIEREVSFNSGRTICDHLDTQRYTIVPIFQTETGTLYLLPQHFLHRGKISDFFHRLEGEAKKITWDQLKQTVDFIYLAVHGRYAEDGTIQGMLEVLGIPYLGSKVLGSALGMDKAMQKSILAASGTDVPRGFVLNPEDVATLTEESLIALVEQHKLPMQLVVKPAHEGSSFGVQIVQTVDELLSAIIAASTIDPRRQQAVVIEEKLSGMEFVCVSLERVTNAAGTVTREWFTLPITEVVLEATTQFFDYEQKYMPGRALKITPARCSQESHAAIVNACLSATKLLHFSTISRIDGFLTPDGRVVIIDPNTLTGMSPSTFLFNQAAEYGMSHTNLINFLIENELHHYGLTQVQSQEQKDAVMTPAQQKTRVAVLLGGDSNERETSLESGRNVCYKLSPHKYDVIPVFVNGHMELFKLNQKLLIKNSTRAIDALVTPDIQIEWSDLPSICDFVFIGLHGGKGEGGAVQGALEMLDLPYNGSGVLASSLCMDKFKTNNFLRTKGFTVPAGALIENTAWQTLTNNTKQTFIQTMLNQAQLSFPLVVKPHDDGCSVMVSKATSVQEICSAVTAMFTANKSGALLEEMIIGTELTCGVVGNHNPVAFPPSMAVAKGGILSMEEKFLPGAGENQTPAPLPSPVLDLVRQTMVDAYKAIGCTGYARIDSFYQTAEQSPTGTERVVILEFNTLPATTPATCLFHQAAEVGMKPMDLIDKIVDLGIEHYRQQHQDKHGLVGARQSIDDTPGQQSITPEQDLNLSLF